MSLNKAEAFQTANAFAKNTANALTSAASYKAQHMHFGHPFYWEETFVDIRTQQSRPATGLSADPVTSESRGENVIRTMTENERGAADHVTTQVASAVVKNIGADNPKPTTAPDHPSISSPQTQAPKKFPVQDLIIASQNVKFGKKEIDEFYVATPTKGKELANEYGLTKQEAAAIHAYTCDYYKPINHQFRTLPLNTVNIYDSKALMKAGVGNPDLAEMIAALSRGLKKLPPAQTSETVFHALGRNVTMEDADLAQYKEGDELSVPTFMSTTVSAKIGRAHV